MDVLNIKKRRSQDRLPKSFQGGMEKCLHPNHAGLQHKHCLPLRRAELLHLGRSLPGAQVNKPGLQASTEGDFGAKQLLITRIGGA